MIAALIVCGSGLATAASLNQFPAPVRAASVTADVRIENIGRLQGSGTVVGRRDGYTYILTARHVIVGADKVRVGTYTPESYPREAKSYPDGEIVRAQADADLALVRVKTADEPPGVVRIAAPGAGPPPSKFDALAVGGAVGIAPTARVEAIAGKRLVRRPDGGEAFYWQAGREPEAGRSGGALLDRDGRLIGVCAAGQNGRGYYTHLREIQAFLKQGGFAWLYE
jgi:S1-C subfamily serine protease